MIKIIRLSKRLVRTNLVVVFSVMIGVACNMALMAQQNPYVQLNRTPYFVIFFVKGEAWAQPRTKEETGRLLRGHLAYLRKHVESGQYALSGPLNDDGPVRGIIVLSAGTAEQAARIVNDDPMVQSRQFGVEVHRGMFPDLSAVRAIYPKSASK